MYLKNVLITGISGFIGRSLVEAIVDSKLPWNIYGIDIKPPRFNDSKYLENIVFDTVDIRNRKAVAEYFATRKFDGVIHLAAVSRVVDAENDKENCIRTNLYGTQYLLENIALTPETWVIFGSSREVYGEQKLLPVKESAAKKPINIYGECKLKGELLVKELITKYAILRFSNVYGNSYDIDGRVIPAFFKRATNGKTLFLEGGNQIIDFTHIDDTTNSIIKVAELLQEGTISTEEIHISPGNENKITDIIACLETYLGKKLNVEIREKRNYDVVRFIGDPSHRMAILGNTTFKTLTEGIAIMINSFRMPKTNHSAISYSI